MQQYSHAWEFTLGGLDEPYSLPLLHFLLAMIYAGGMQPKVKLKPWGREIWWADTPKYAGKILEVKQGERLSLQYHRYKEETQYLYSGKVKLVYGPDQQHLRTKTLLPGQAFHIPPRLIHRVVGVAPLSIIFEVSTPHLTDVVKLSDDYGRQGSGNDEVLDKKLAKKSR